MKRISVFAIVATAGACLAAPIYTEDFQSQDTKWTKKVHGDLVKVEFGGKGRNFTGLLVTGVQPKNVDTAWSVLSPRIDLPAKRDPFFEISFDVDPDVALVYTGEYARQWKNAIFWYDANGKDIGTSPVNFSTRAGGFRTIRVADKVPPDARSCAIQLGFDGPNLWGNSVVAYKNLSLSLVDSLDKVQKMEKLDRGDFSPPRVKMTSPSPTANRKMKPSFIVTDESEIDWSAFKVELDGKDVTTGFVRSGDTFTWNGATDWADGIHKVDVTVADTLKHAYTARKRFFIGEAPKVPKVTLRDDGMTLVDGEPYFPIGLYGVMRREFNDNDFKKAFDGLEKGGFNTSHSYGEARAPEYLAEAKSHGFRIWMETRLPDTRFANTERHYDYVLAWYLGDDTSGHEKPWELRDYDEATKAVDPNRITCQADGVRSAVEFSAYHDYVDGTDVFLPEIYPMAIDDEENNRECVARVIRDMKRVHSDIRDAKDGRPHGIWPIIQYFQGWGWKHFPSREELFGMTFAAICHGAHGMTWYAYCGRVRPEKNQYNYGVTSTPERWANICDLATRLKGLAPVLVERTGKQPAAPKVLSGPQTDPLGHPSISYLLKKHAGAAYLFAVNSASDPVTARFALKAGCTVEVLYEDRNVTVSDEGLTETFAPFGVHIYRITR